MGQRTVAPPTGLSEPRHDTGLQHAKRVVLTTSAKAGDKFEIAIFGINGPISVAPPNFIWFREARIEFYKYGGTQVCQSNQSMH